MEDENMETTLGELIVALTEETSRLFPDEKDTYRVVAYILSELFSNSRPASTKWH
ncbi:MAG: hypothetical protein HY695_02835 [Deltaproteobacteria bacterium]|nr:hypothetical protein [Deltaproteobacteria bacterium]